MASFCHKLYCGAIIFILSKMMKRAVFVFVFCILSVPLFPQEMTTIDDSLDLAVLFKEGMEYEKTQAVLESALKESDDIRVTRILAKIYYLNGHPKKGLELFKKITEKGWWDFLYLGL